MLSGSSAEVVQLGALIARTHHERWDGSGYPCGLAGENIPLEGRIAAVADVFDALTSDRVYRAALPVKSAIEMMQDERGRHFDPELLDAFFLALGEIEAIRHAYSD
jgi:putative two-component system response regulator